MSDHENIKITDFGLSKIARADANTISSVTGDGGGSKPWMAPEVLNEERFKAKPADVYSYAMVLVELVSGDIPWAELIKRNPIAIYGKVLFKEVRQINILTKSPTFLTILLLLLICSVLRYLMEFHHFSFV